MENRKKFANLFVTGTDTGVGKTVLSLLLMQFFYRQGYVPYYLKPVQTGCHDPHAGDSDARFIYRHVKALAGQDPGDSVIYCLENPKAPYFAARDEAREIDFAKIQAVMEAKSAVFSPLIIEGAGGLFVPVTERLMVIDMIQMTGARPLIAARAGLGTINHTLLTVDALRRRGMEAAGIILLAGGKEATQPNMLAENIAAIEKNGEIKVGGVIGKIDDFSNPPRHCYEPLEKIFLNLFPDPASPPVPCSERREAPGGMSRDTDTCCHDPRES
jgi:dethiobiotin synthetase